MIFLIYDTRHSTNRRQTVYCVESGPDGLQQHGQHGDNVVQQNVTSPAHNGTVIRSSGGGVGVERLYVADCSPARDAGRTSQDVAQQEQVVVQASQTQQRRHLCQHPLNTAAAAAEQGPLKASAQMATSPHKDRLISFGFASQTHTHTRSTALCPGLPG